MSEDIGIHAWLDDDAVADWPLIVDRFLDRIGSHAFQLEEGSGFSLRIFDRFGEIERELTVAPEVLPDQLRALAPFTAEIAFEVGGSYPYSSYDPRSGSLLSRRREFQLKLVGPRFGYQGFEYRSNGPLRITFANVKSFAVPLELVERVQRRCGTAIAELNMMADVAKNYEIVTSVLHAIIECGNPSTALVCIAAQVHPLTSQAVYHADLKRFVVDCDEIAWLHDHSGFYLAETPAESVLNPPPPRKEVHGYGYYRKEESGFRGRVGETFVGPQWGESLNEEDVRLALDDSGMGEEVESLGAGACVKTRNPPYGYVNGFYFRLAQRLKLLLARC